VSEAVVVLRVLRAGERTDGLLAAVGRALVAHPLQADDYGAISVRVPRRGPEAWDEVRDALDRRRRGLEGMALSAATPEALSPPDRVRSVHQAGHLRHLARECV
jgi:hypothetical protein